jgi:CRP-like cAMP-binding protein
MDDLLARTADLPQIALAAGDTLVHEGDSGNSLWVLVSGALQVRKGDIAINTIT